MFEFLELFLDFFGFNQKISVSFSSSFLSSIRFIKICKLFINCSKSFLLTFCLGIAQSLFLFDNKCLFFDFKLTNFSFEFHQIIWKWCHPHFDACCSFIDQINRFIRKPTISDISYWEINCSNHCSIRNLHSMVCFIITFDSSKNWNCILFFWFVDHHWLKSSFKCRIFFDIFTIFIDSCCSDDAHLTSGKGWFQHIPHIHRSLGLASSYHIV